MAYNEFLADRVRASLKGLKSVYAEKKMFGGLVFMVQDKMCVGIIKDELMVRIDSENEDDFLKEEGCRLMDFTKRRMKGYLYVAPEGIDMDEDLDKWVQRCLDFNPKAKASKK
jgi:TfoX/Sxy family transcriptional regulator of competence genes